MSTSGFPQVWGDFRKFWFGQTISLLGDQILITAMPFLILQLGGSDAQAELVLFATYLPFMFFGLPIGSFLERYSKRSVMLLTDVSQMLLFAVLLLLGMTKILNFSLIMSFLVLDGIAVTFFQIAFNSYAPILFQQRKFLEKANTRLALSETASLAIGPIIAGALVAKINSYGALGIDALSFLLSATALFTIRFRDKPATITTSTENPTSTEKRSLLRESVEGLKVVIHHPVLKPVIGGASLYIVCLTILNSLMVLFYTKVLHQSPNSLGLLIGLAALGYPFGVFLSVQARKKLALESTLIVSGFTAIAGNVLMVVSIFLPARCAVASFFVANFIRCTGEGGFNLLCLTLRQINSPAGMVSRIAGVHRTLFYSGTVTGSFIAYVVTNAADLKVTLIVGCLATLLLIPILYSGDLRANASAQNEEEAITAESIKP